MSKNKYSNSLVITFVLILKYGVYAESDQLLTSQEISMTYEVISTYMESAMQIKRKSNPEHQTREIPSRK